MRPRGLGGRMALVLAVALLLELVGNIALQRWQDRELVSEGDTRMLAQRLVRAERLATAAPSGERARLLGALSVPGMAFNWVPRTVITDLAGSLSMLGDMRGRIVRAAPSLAGRPLSLTILPSSDARRRDLVGTMRLADGSFVSFRVSPYLAATPHPVATVLIHLLLTGAVLALALVAIRALVRPLGDLARAADAAGHRRMVDVPVAGPHEVRRVGVALAAMQARLLAIVEDHSRALIAVSHDLRTPLQRMQLRSALIEDAETREPLARDLLEMEHFIESTLAYVRDDESEAARFVDLAAIVISAVDDAADAGAAIVYAGPDSLLNTTRPIAIKRVLANLIGNAVRHAAHVAVSLAGHDEGGFVLSVDDDGPGIPAALREEMLLPFRRDAANCGGGAGLGLAIASKAVTAMGGTMTLGDSRLGGLSVVVRVQERPAASLRRVPF